MMVLKYWGLIMMVLKYWGLMAIQLYTIAWCYLVGMAAIDLTLIGHIKGWKRIKYPKWLGGAIDKKRRYGYEGVSDQVTHPQVIWFISGSALVLGGIVGLIVAVWQFVNDVDPWVLWAIAAALYVPSVICLILLKSYAKRVYLSYQSLRDEGK